jgi:mutator protein MutT
MENNDKQIIVALKAVIYNDTGQILTIRRSKTAGRRALTWDLPGGNLEFGEVLQDCVLREIKEETGIEVENLLILGTSEGFDSENVFRVTVGYTAKATSTDVILSYEHDDFRWVTPEEFTRLDIYEPHRELIHLFSL